MRSRSARVSRCRSPSTPAASLGPICRPVSLRSAPAGRSRCRSRWRPRVRSPRPVSLRPASAGRSPGLLCLSSLLPQCVKQYAPKLPQRGSPSPTIPLRVTVSRADLSVGSGSATSPASLAGPLRLRARLPAPLAIPLAPRSGALWRVLGAQLGPVLGVGCQTGQLRSTGALRRSPGLLSSALSLGGPLPRLWAALLCCPSAASCRFPRRASASPLGGPFPPSPASVGPRPRARVYTYTLARGRSHIT